MLPQAVFPQFPQSMVIDHELEAHRKSLWQTLSQENPDGAQLQGQVDKLCKFLSARKHLESLRGLQADGLAEHIERWANNFAIKFQNPELLRRSMDIFKANSITGDSMLDEFSSKVEPLMVDSHEFSYTLRRIIIAVIRFGTETTALAEIEPVERMFPIDGDQVIKICGAKYLKSQKVATCGHDALTADVYLGHWENHHGTITEVAIKDMSMKDRHGAVTPHARMKQAEIDALKEVQHENVIKYLDSINYKSDHDLAERACLILERCDTDLMKAMSKGLKEYPTFDSRVTKLCGGICKGLRVLHNIKGLCHRDIKPQNVLLKKCGGEWIPKVCDMGFALRTTDQLSRTSKLGSASLMEVGLGTEGYMAPEIDGADVFYQASDIFALGITMYEALTTTSGKSEEHGIWLHPFYENQLGLETGKKAKFATNKIYNNIDEDKRHMENDEGVLSAVVRIQQHDPSAHLPLAKCLVGLIDRMTANNRHQRPKIDDVLSVFNQHPALSDGTHRYEIMDKLMKGTGRVTAKFSGLVAKELLDTLKTWPGGDKDCAATAVHEAWKQQALKITPRQPGWKDGRKMYPGTRSKGAREGHDSIVKQVRKGRFEKKKSSFSDGDPKREQWLTDYADMTDEEKDSDLHRYDGQGDFCLCGARARSLSLLHVHKNCLWGQSDALQWSTNGWELAKLYGSALGPRAPTCTEPGMADITIHLSFSRQCTVCQQFALKHVSQQDWDTWISRYRASDYGQPLHCFPCVLS